MDIEKQIDDIFLLRQENRAESVLAIEDGLTSHIESAKTPQDIQEVYHLAVTLSDLLEQEQNVNMWRKCAVARHLRHNWDKYLESNAVEGNISFDHYASKCWGREYYAWLRAYEMWVINVDNLEWVNQWSLEERVRTGYGKVSRISNAQFRVMEVFECAECGKSRNGPGDCPTCGQDTTQHDEHVANALVDENQHVDDVKRALRQTEDEYYSTEARPWAELVGNRVILHKPDSLLDAVCPTCGETQVYGSGKCPTCDVGMELRSARDVALIEILDIQTGLDREWVDDLLRKMNVRQ
jgi:rubrerythrin